VLNEHGKLDSAHRLGLRVSLFTRVGGLVQEMFLSLDTLSNLYLPDFEADELLDIITDFNFLDNLSFHVEPQADDCAELCDQVKHTPVVDTRAWTIIVCFDTFLLEK
jgi:hypothetical protein